MGNTTIVITKETFVKLSKAKYEFLAHLTDDGLVPRISNDKFVSKLVDNFVMNSKNGKTSK